MNEHDKRREFRRPSSDRMFLQIVSSDNPDLVSTTVSCIAVDVSASGLRIRTEHEIPAGSNLDLWIDDSAGPGKYFLSSDVRWTKEVEDGFESGVELHEGAATDIDEWRQRQMHG